MADAAMSLVSPPQMALINGSMGDAPLVNAQQQGLADLPAMVEICVCDSGIGIPGEHLERIFDRFHRVDTRLTREVDGLGLGLAICKRIVELHKGRIWAESLPGEGSTFHVLLPVADAEMQ